MINIRYGMFETNSSSTHSLIIASEKEYEKLERNELFIDRYSEKFITKDKVIDQLVEAAEDEKTAYQMASFFVNELEMIPPQFTKEGFDTLSSDELNRLLQELELNIYSLENYMNDDYLESFEERYVTEHGDKLVIFGKYGNDY